MAPDRLLTKQGEFGQPPRPETEVTKRKQALRIDRTLEFHRPGNGNVETNHIVFSRRKEGPWVIQVL